MGGRRGTIDGLARWMAVVAAVFLAAELGANAQLPVMDGLALWLDASQLTALNDGDQVDSWTDLSGQNNPALRQGGSSAGYPQYKTGQLNGKAVVRFDSANGDTGDYLKFNRVTTIRTVFWVVRERAALTDGHFLLGDDNSFDFHRQSANGPLWDGGLSSANIRGGTTRLMGTAVDGTSTGIPADQYQLISLVTAGDVQANQITQDRVFHGSWQGDIAEILIYTKALTDQEESLVGGYLAGKYGLATAYPPFNPAAPYGLTATPGDGQVALAWGAFPGATSYNVKRALVTGGPYGVIATPDTNAYTDTAVTNATTYYYVVSAMTNAVETDDSAEAFATPATVDAGASTVAACPSSVWADGSAYAIITVTLKNAGSLPVPGKTIALAHTSGPGSPVITTVSGTTDDSGVATFTVASLDGGADEFTATDTTDSLVVTQTATVNFVPRPADISDQLPGMVVLKTWDAGTGWDDWGKARTTSIDCLGNIVLGKADDPGSQEGWIEIDAPAGMSYANSGLEVSFILAPRGGLDWHNDFTIIQMLTWENTFGANPRQGFHVWASGDFLTSAHTTQINRDGDWSTDDWDVMPSPMPGLHTMALVRFVDGTLETYVDGALVNTQTTADPVVPLTRIGVGVQVAGNWYLTRGTVVSQVRAFTVDPPVGPVDADVSTVVASPATVRADGEAVTRIIVTLKDAAGFPVGGKDVSLAKTAGPDGPVITPATQTTTDNGKAIFTVASTNVGADEFTATDTTDALELSQKPTVTFVEPGILAMNVNIDNAARTGLVGPAGGPGEIWNQFPLAGAGPVDASGLLDTNGAGTAVGFTCTAGSVGSWDGPALTMLTGGAFTWGEPSSLTITNLPAGKKYDLYLASYYYNEQGSKATFVTANATTNGTTQLCNNGGGGAESATWVEGQNYVVFQAMEPDTNRIVSVTMTRTDPGLYAHLSGFQLMEAVIPTPRKLDGALLLIR